MQSLITEKVKFHAIVLLLAFCPLLHPNAAHGQMNHVAAPVGPSYNCYGTFVDEETYAALIEQALANQPIVSDLFGLEVSCGGTFALDYEPVLEQVTTPTGKVVLIPDLETIPGQFVFGDTAVPFDCVIYGYWESDFTQPPWSTELSPEELAQLLAVNATLGMLWARLEGDCGSVYVSWQLMAFDTEVEDPARAVTLLADGSTETEAEDIAQFHQWRAIQAGWHGDPPSPPPPPAGGGGFPGGEAQVGGDGPTIGPLDPPGVKALPELPCTGNPEAQYCLDLAKDRYYDCLYEARDGRDQCIQDAATDAMLYALACAGLAFAPGWLFWYVLCVAGVMSNFSHKVADCRGTYRIEKRQCYILYLLESLSCCNLR